MDFFRQLFSNHILWVSIFACFLAQFIKIFTGREKRVDPSRIFMSGGMPSSHSSFVTSLATFVVIYNGFDSMEFAICIVFGLIVMYDASGVRKAAGDQAKVINDLQEMLHTEVPVYLKELLGHTRLEVIVGCLLGIAIALCMFL